MNQIVDVRGMTAEQKLAIIGYFEAVLPSMKRVTKQNTDYIGADALFFSVRDDGTTIVTHSGWLYASDKLYEQPDRYRLVVLKLTEKVVYDVKETVVSSTVVVDGMLYRLVGLAAKENKK